MIRKTVLLTSATLAFSLAALPGQWSGPAAIAAEAEAASGGADSRSSAEGEIRAQALAYEKAFEEKDLDKIIAMWLPEGSYTGPYGKSAEGVAAIKEVYKNFFDTAGDAKLAMKIDIESIRLIGDDTAIERGTITNTSNSGKATRYTVIHVKRDGTWKIANAVEHIVHQPRQTVDDLGWLLGKWKAAGKEGSVEIEADMAANKKFIVLKFMAKTSDDIQHRDIQIVGTDPATGSVASWMFDSDGGVGKGYWFHDGKSWIVETVRNDGDGSRIVYTQVITPNGPDAYLWKAVDQAVDGIAIPDKTELKIEKIQ